jgi:mono/diheme cytochrome c family protein/glucose/arabinose dehydrogenase
MICRAFLAVLLLLSASAPVIADEGPLAPDEALKSFKIARGFRVELVASEPLVDHPVAIDHDADGRIWVVEMPSYMKDADASGLTAPTGRVVVLTDANGDGKPDTRTVFLDGLVLPRAVKVIGKGALVGEPPHLWYCPDEDGDLKADKKVAVASDYFLRADNPELGPNTPLWALDNWIYQAAYSSRLRWERGTFRREGDLEKGQWGITQDDFGRLFYNVSYDQLRGDLVPAHYYLRNPSSATRSGIDHPIATDQTIWPARPTPDVNDGGKPDKVRPDGTLREFSAACGPLIYRGDAWPAEFNGNAFVCEPAANLVKRNVLKENGLLLEAKPAYQGTEFLSSTDGWFRPVGLANAPDGTLHVVDMYKAIILYKPFMTDHMKKQVAQRADPPRPLGRIWRIVHAARRPALPPKASALPTPQLVAALQHPSGWWRDTAQSLLVERQDAAAAAPLKQIAANAQSPRVSRLHALWTLEGLGALDEATVLAALRDADRKIRAAGVRLAEPLLRSQPGGAAERELVALAADKQREVRVQVAFSLGEGTSAATRAAQLALMKSAPGDIFLVDAVLSGLHGREVEVLDALRKEPSWASTNAGRVRAFRLLAQSIVRARDAAAVSELLGVIAGGAQPAAHETPHREPERAAPAQPGWREATLLEAVYDAVRFGTLPPIPIAAEPAAFAAFARSPDPTTAQRATKVLENVTWPGKPGQPAAPAPRALTAEEEQRFARGRALYTSDCASCHQADGLGQRGRAPPLLGSAWVQRSPKALGRILLQGLKGPITVHVTEWSLEMPALPHLDDEQAAAILTYIRRSWGNQADPVDASTVGEVRAATKDRKQPWTAQELEKVE